MDKNKNIGLVAHDHMKHDLIEWVEHNWEILIDHKLTCTGTTGKLVEEAIMKKMISSEKSVKDIHMTKLKSEWPLGGDQQLGSMIAEGNIDILIFFWAPHAPATS